MKVRQAKKILYQMREVHFRNGKIWRAWDLAHRLDSRRVGVGKIARKACSCWRIYLDTNGIREIVQELVAK